MPRASTRYSQASQSQQPSQSQSRTRRSRASRAQEESAEEDEATQPDPGEDEMDVDNNDLEADLTRKVNDLVRLALFTESKRVALRRDDIKKVLPQVGARSFNKILEGAQKKLSDTFGMTLVEVPTRAALAEEAAGDDDEATQAANGARRKASSGQKTWVLRSVLDRRLIQAAAQDDRMIFEDELADKNLLFPELYDDEAGEDQGERYPQDHGSIISWTRCDQLGSIGILYVVLALILVSSRSMPDVHLRRALKTLHLGFNNETSGNRPVRHTTISSVRAQSIEEFLNSLLSKNYLDRIEIGGDAGKKGKRTTSKRVRAQEQEEDGKSLEWRWGPRAHVEIGEEAIGRFIAEFMILDKGSDDEGDGGANASEPTRQQDAAITKMLNGIATAAGGALTPLREAV